MTPSLLPPLRLLLSAVLAVSFALTMLAGGHHPCRDSVAGHGVASPTASHAGMDASHGKERSAGDTTKDTTRDCPDHDRYDERSTAACAVAAHCTSGAVASDVLVPAPQLRLVALKLELTASRPPDASYQPDPPPPKA